MSGLRLLPLAMVSPTLTILEIFGNMRSLLDISLSRWSAQYQNAWLRHDSHQSDQTGILASDEGLFTFVYQHLGSSHCFSSYDLRMDWFSTAEIKVICYCGLQVEHFLMYMANISSCTPQHFLSTLMSSKLLWGIFRHAGNMSVLVGPYFSLQSSLCSQH